MDIRFIGSRDGIFQGTRNDIVIDPITKDFQTIEGPEYVKQKVVKVLLTPNFSDLDFPTYGSLLKDQLFADILDPSVQSTITDTIVSALNYIEAQETSTREDERIQSIDQIELIANPAEQSVALRVVVTLQNNETVVFGLGS